MAVKKNGSVDAIKVKALSAQNVLSVHQTHSEQHLGTLQ